MLPGLFACQNTLQKRTQKTSSVKPVRSYLQVKQGGDAGVERYNGKPHGWVENHMDKWWVPVQKTVIIWEITCQNTGRIGSTVATCYSNISGYIVTSEPVCDNWLDLINNWGRKLRSFDGHGWPWAGKHPQQCTEHGHSPPMGSRYLTVTCVCTATSPYLSPTTTKEWTHDFSDLAYIPPVTHPKKTKNFNQHRSLV